MSIPKMHADEFDTDVSLAQRLINTQFPEWSHLEIRPVKSAGTDNALYRLGDEMVMRLPRVLSASKQGDKEQQWLPILAPQLPLAIPIPIAAGKAAEGFPWHWFIFPWFNGEDASVLPVSDPKQSALALAEFLFALHRLDTAGGPLPGEHNFFRGEPLINRDKETREAIISLNQDFNAKSMLNIWNNAINASVWDKAPCWIHGDLLPTNMLVENGRLSAVIDFGGLGVGDPACDLIVAWAYLSKETREIFRAKLSVDDATWARGQGWALTFGLSAFGYYRNTNPILAGIGKRAVDEVIAVSA